MSANASHCIAFWQRPNSSPGGIDRPSRAEDIKPLGLTAQEKADLIAFLDTLTAAPATVAVTTLPR